MKKRPFKLKKTPIITVAILLSFVSTPLYARDGDERDGDERDGDEKVTLDAVTIVGDVEERQRSPGSVHKVDQEMLEQWHYRDVHRVLKAIPGVYVLDEEGFGLRPNIGMRGSGSHRSRKIVMMEDGVLLAPAPYSAPAAYYFPVMARIQAVEVSKGPSAIKYGPNTVGGAINFVSRDIPGADDANGRVDVSLGSFGFGQLHGFYGDSTERFGWLLEGVHMQADGFKELDDGGGTGFEKNDVLLKMRFNSDLAADVYHQFDIKLGYANEVGDETYLGLSDKAFAANPLRRYASTQHDFFEWDHQQFALSHFYDPGGDFVVSTTVYQRNFRRRWDKINHFDGRAPTLRDIISNPDTPVNMVFYDVLTGQEDSYSPDETIMLLNADREFISKGIQSRLQWRPTIAGVDHLFTVGIRYHHDEVERDHWQRGFLMRSGQLVRDARERTQTIKNQANAQALAVYLQNQVMLGDLTITPGFRHEHINTEFTNLVTNETVLREDNVFIPGLGVNYRISPGIHLLGGVHKGFVPVRPDADIEVKPEESINYEFGLRYNRSGLAMEAIGFFNDYSNLTGECIAACIVGAGRGIHFNAGEVHIWGLETMAVRTFTTGLGGGLTFPVRFTYTYTDSEFRTNFDSPEFGVAHVRIGYKMPHLPEHQLNLQVAVEQNRWHAALSFNYVAEMRTVAGVGTPVKSQRTDAQQVVDLSANYQLGRNSMLYFTVNNLFDDVAIVSRRLVGARSGKPRSLLLGYKVDF